MKKLPPSLLLALAIEVVSVLVFGLHEMFGSPGEQSIALSLAGSGMAIVTYALGISGFLELAGRTTGRTRIGLLVAAAGFAVGLADMAFWHGVIYVQPHWSEEKFGLIQQWGWFAVNLLPVLGLVIATWKRDRRAALIGLVVLLIADPLPPLGKHMYGWVGHTWTAMIGLENALRLVEVIVVFVLARLVTESEAPGAPERATSGLRAIGAALWLRVVAAMGTSLLMLMMANAGQGSIALMRLALFGGAVISALSLVMMARGALRAASGGVADLPRAPLTLVAAGALWCLGVALFQLPFMYRLFYGDHDGWDVGSHDLEYVQALAVAVPLVATAAIAAVAAAVASFASRRGLEQLRAEAHGKGAGFVGLMLASIAMQTWLLPKADSLGILALTTIGAAILGLWATIQMARLCAIAADSLHETPGLPTATLKV